MTKTREIIEECVFYGSIVLFFIALITCFFNFSTIWTGATIVYLTGGLMVLFTAFCGYMDPNYRTSRFQDRVGILGVWLMVIAAVGMLLQLILWIF